MPLKPTEVLYCLTQKQAEFQDFNQTSYELWQRYRQALGAVSRQTAMALFQQLKPYRSPGAHPLEPWSDSDHWVIPAHLTWPSREHSLQWVRDRLTGITTFAVDGSQIFPSKEVSIPVALVQVGWFENPHLPTGTYEKDVRLEVLSPSELQQCSAQRPLDRQVNMHRFRMEIERLIEFMAIHPQCSDCLVFLDGSLVATFAEVFDADCRAFYAHWLVELLRASERYRVPLVAYIDSSHACDLVQVLQHVQDLPEALSLQDAALVGAEMAWGDRTPLFWCDRAGERCSQGILQDYQEQAQCVAFTYLKTCDRPPARLEMPRWIYDAGLLEFVLNCVRAEVIIGGGYPYVIETADQVAVLQTQDRQLFYRLLQQWAEDADLNLRFSRKMASKVFRR
ncbi:DNA double-strand break repair nuclease NurA [Synechococcales cyanobacterium C]|uniref:DNA double-strand break repair nuclease NurA n=2 Tax=Petrachloros TaxID=2918834 RepID=A0A8K1ZVZ7_9CYAN|nr:DNA double-strand break repair nuclease NurA [Petrachloros mirabilis]NCJ06149.1 DNA double-strand break repair nuclease NurA [Petrachloros mirabilis ULC683]